jgi:hypothetical protein
VGHLAVGLGLPVLQEVDLQIEVGVVEGGAVEVAEPMVDTALIGHLVGRRGRGLGHPLEQELVVVRLGTQDETQVQGLQLADVGGVGGEPILDHDQLQVGMLAAQVFQQPLGGVALAVVLLGPIRLEDRLGGEGEHLLVVRMHQHGTQHLVVVGDGAVAVVLFAALLAMDGVGGEVAGTVQGEEVMTPQVAEPLQPLAALQGAEQPLVEGVQQAGVHLVEALPKAGVAGGALNAVQALEVGAVGIQLAALVELEQRGVLEPEQGQPRHQVVH